MWPIPALDHDVVSVSFSSDSIACTWIQKIKNATAPLIIRAYKRYPLHNLELVQLKIFNPNLVQQYISSFLHEHNKTNAFIVFSVDGPGIVEEFITMPTSTPHRIDFAMPQSSNLLWEYRYVYTNDHGQYIFYVYAVARSLVLQYELLAIALQCNLIGITTKNMALLCAYKNIFGVAFRRSQLAIDMMRSNNIIETVITDDTLRRMMSIPSDIILAQERSYIIAACGLFCGEELGK